MIRRIPVLLMLIAIACSPGEQGIVSIMDGNRFDPSTITLRVGETLSFVNDSNQAHTVTAYEDSLPDGLPYFASGGFKDEESARDGVTRALIDPGESFEVSFPVPGLARYFCLPHEDQGMIGTIVVEAMGPR